MLHFHDATTIRFAEKAAAAGVDGIVAIGAGGGGHAGTISHLAFIPQVRAMFDGTVVMAGAVTTGATIRAAEMLGADLAYIGTRFIATKESTAPDAYKAMLVEGGVTDVIYTRGVNGLARELAQGLAALSRASIPDNLLIPEGRRTDHLPRRQDALARHLERRPGHRPDPRHPDRCRTRAQTAAGICRRLRDPRHGRSGKGCAVSLGGSSMSDRVIRQDSEGLCTLTLNRPEKLNALDTLAFEELDAHLAALEGEMDRIGCVVDSRSGARLLRGRRLGRHWQGAGAAVVQAARDRAPGNCCPSR